MANLTVGCNFDKKLIDFAKENNLNPHNNKVTEFYGSIALHSNYTARPKYRLPNVSERYLAEYIDTCNKAGISFNYTLNTLYPGSKREVYEDYASFISLVKFLHRIGVKSITISNPIYAEIIRASKIQINITISTIAHIDTVTQIKIWKERYNISKVYANILKNRSIRFLENASAYCAENNIELSLLANEFCGNGLTNNDGTSSSTHCIYRDSCFLFHSENKELNDDSLFNNFPMDKCINSRNDVETWLKTRFIRPEDIKKYESIGITNFKITGRTGSTAYLKTIINAYSIGKWNGNLLSLWKPLETIKTKEKELSFKHKLHIDNKRLDNFVDYWFNNKNHECANELCGVTCTYCNDFAKNIK